MAKAKKKAAKSARMVTPKPVLLASLKQLRAQGVPFLKLADLVPWKGNPLKLEDALVDEMVATLQHVGWTQPITYRDEDRRIVAGHRRRLAATKLGLVEVPAIPLSLSNRLADVASIGDNAHGMRREWDFGALKKATEAWSVTDLRASGFDSDAIWARAKRMVAENTPEQLPPDTPKSFRTKRGDLWALGEHRILCGDSENLEAAHALVKPEGSQLVVTDPPYAIYGSSTGITSSIADDRMVVAFFEKVCALARHALPWFGHAYFFCDWRSWSALWEAARRAEMAAKNVLVWDKGGGLGSMYAQCYEQIGFFVKQPIQTAVKGTDHRGQRTVHRPNLLRFTRPTGEDRRHNAAKPVGLLRELIVNSSDKGGRVFDPFLGSGSTLLACEAEGRACDGIDIEPKWIDITIERWEKLTGKKAQRLTLGE